MVVLCPNCQSRYQLSEDKIKPTGTKVRCPRCQNAFKVFPAPPPDDSEEPTKTEFLARGKPNPEDTASTLTGAPAQKPKPPAPPPTPQSSKKIPSPFKRQIPDEDEESTPIVPPPAAKPAAPKPAPPSVRKPPPPAPPPPPAASPVLTKTEARTKLSEKQSPPPHDRVEGNPFAAEQKTRVNHDGPTSPVPSPFKGKTSGDDFGNDFSVPSDLDSKIRFSGFSKTDQEPTDPPARAEFQEPSANVFQEGGSETPSEIARPFGDETFMEIQKASNQSRVQSKKILIGTGIAIGLGIVFFAISRIPKQATKSPTGTTPVVETTPPPVSMNEKPPEESRTRITIHRPLQWYREEASVFQDFLAQLATSTQSEQQKPENRAVIAEALILNGLMSGEQDQISSGLAYASGLLAHYPSTVYGFYGLSDYALWREDIPTLTDLVRRWPEENQTDPEFRLSKLVVESRQFENSRGALEQAKNLLADFPDFFRAKIWTYYISIDAPEDAQRILGLPALEELAKTYKLRRETFKRSQPLPLLFQNIDRRLARRGSPLGSSAITKPTPPPKIATPVPTPRPTPVPQETKTVVTPTPPPVAVEKPAPAHEEVKSKSRKANSHLPKASSDLIALNRKNRRDRTEAEKFFEIGNARFREEKTAEALEAYQKSLSLNPDFPEVYKRLGQIYMGRKEKEKALKNFKIYLQLKPSSEDKQLVEGWINSLQ